MKFKLGLFSIFLFLISLNILNVAAEVPLEVSVQIVDNGPQVSIWDEEINRTGMRGPIQNLKELPSNNYFLIGLSIILIVIAVFLMVVFRKRVKKKRRVIKKYGKRNYQRKK